MTRYLIKRQNRYGHWIHIDTIKTIPKSSTWESYLKKYGPGKYMVLVAAEKVRGLRMLDGGSIKKVAPEFELLTDPTIWTGKPDKDDLVKAYGKGDYLVAKLTEVEPIMRDRSDKVDHNVISDMVWQAADSFRGAYVVYRLLDIPE